MAAHVAAHRDKFNCAACVWGRHCDSRNPAPFAQWSIPGVIESRTCLLPMVRPWQRELIGLYQHYKNGLLPFAGGVLDQPHYYAEAMALLDPVFKGLKADLDREAFERARS